MNKSLKVKRAYLTNKEFLDMWQAQHSLCGCGCGELLNHEEGTIDEHVWWMVALGNDGKPDKIYRKPCADEKTNGLCGDKWRIAKVKRHRNNKTQADKRRARGYSLIQGRNTLAKHPAMKRLFSGKVVPRG